MTKLTAETKFTVNVKLPNGYAYRLEAGSKAAATKKVNETLKYNPGAEVTVLPRA